MLCRIQLALAAILPPRLCTLSGGGIQISRFLHTEVVYTDHDLMHAKQGAAVLAVHCPDERTRKTAWRLIAPTDPLTARHYSIGGIEHLAGKA